MEIDLFYDLVQKYDGQPLFYFRSGKRGMHEIQEEFYEEWPRFLVYEVETLRNPTKKKDGYYRIRFIVEAELQLQGFWIAEGSNLSKMKFSWQYFLENNRV